MSAFFFQNLPDHLKRQFCAVRSAADNIWNLLVIAEIANTASHLMTRTRTEEFDVAIFSGPYSRALVKKQDGYFSMALPFQMVDDGEYISFNLDGAAMPISGQFLSALRNSVTTWRAGECSSDDISLSLMDDFGISSEQAILWAQHFIELLSHDHGFLRFDDDQANEMGNVHPRFHFDFFYSNHSSIKVGMDELVTMDCFYALFDKSLPKRFLRTH
ncbi:hypothetical protein B9Y66_05490 [Stenotrophomonas maltophilia]|nr:hypothetical protein B9Y66_05490 [Stenotrophomonas maltophilia]